MNHESPVINGDGTYSRDFTYIDNVVQMNLLALTTQNEEALNEVYNILVADMRNPIASTQLIKQCISKYEPDTSTVDAAAGHTRPAYSPNSSGMKDK